MSTVPVEASRGRWMTEAVVKRWLWFPGPVWVHLDLQEEQEVLLVTEPPFQPFLRNILNHH